MADIHLLRLRPDLNGIDRLARDLERQLASNSPLAPRSTQMHVCASGLQHLCDSLRHATEQMRIELATEPAIDGLCKSLHEFADAFSRLASTVQSTKA